MATALILALAARTRRQKGRKLSALCPVCEQDGPEVQVQDQREEAIPTAEGWQLSNAPVLSMAAHKASLDIFDEVGMEKLLAKSKKLPGYLHFVLDDINVRLKHKVVEVITPSAEKDRGCQVSMLMLEKGREIFDALNKEGVIADWREPNVIRVAPVPLYNSFEDVWMFGNIIETILKN
jgi:kynureninase